MHTYAMAREERPPLGLSVGVRGGGGGGGGYPLHLDHSIPFYAGGFMNSYFRHFEGMGVFIEHNEQFEIQGVDQ